MGVEYSANFGIGYQVKISEDIEEDINEYLDENLNDNFCYFEVGSDYSTDNNDVFVVLKDPWNQGFDLTVNKELLDLEIKKLELEVIGDFKDVGGLLIY